VSKTLGNLLSLQQKLSVQIQQRCNAARHSLPTTYQTVTPCLHLYFSFFFFSPLVLYTSGCYDNNNNNNNNEECLIESVFLATVFWYIVYCQLSQWVVWLCKCLLCMQRAGYTIEELFQLSRSINVPQRCLALAVLSKIIRNVRLVWLIIMSSTVHL